MFSLSFFFHYVDIMLDYINTHKKSKKPSETDLSDQEY